MEQLPINADTTNKIVDIANESTKEIRKEIDKTAAKGFSKLAQLFWATPLGIKADVYIQERPYKLEKEIKKMQAKYDCIPAEYQVEPSSYIALKGVNELEYCLEEDHLKEMFENLLISDMDSRKKSKVLPSYIEIVKQLSKDDADILKYFYDKNMYSEAIMKIRYDYFSGGFKYYSNNIFLLVNDNYKILDSIVIDNLSRLNLINVSFDTQLNEPSLYNSTFERIKKLPEFNNIPSKLFELGHSDGLIKITDFGKNFIDICLS